MCREKQQKRAAKAETSSNMLGTQMMDFLALKNWSELFQGNGRGQGRNLRSQLKMLERQRKKWLQQM